MRIIHSADWHLNSTATFAGSIVRDSSGVNLRWRDQQEALAAFVAGAIEAQATLCILAGDLFDTSRPGVAEIVTAQATVYQLARRMTVVILPGNHDPAVAGAPAAVQTLATRGKDTWVMTRPDVIELPDCSIACLPFPSRGMLLADERSAGMSHEEINALLSTKLRAIVRGLRAKRPIDRPAILAAHLATIGAAMNADQVAGQEHVSLTREDLEGWDLVCLGDLHLRQQVTARAYYPGVMTRGNYGEASYPTGWLLHTMDGGALTTEEREIPGRAWVTLPPEELAGAEPVEGTVYRVKGEVSQAEYDALQPVLARWRQYPLFSESLDVSRQTRARAKMINGELSPEAALVEWARTQRKEESLAALMEEHGRMVEVAK